MKVKIDIEKCIGCGSCAAVCGEVFEMKDNKAYFKEDKTETESDAECLEEGISICPVQAIIKAEE